MTNLYRNFAELLPFLALGAVLVALLVLALNHRRLKNGVRTWKSLAGTWLVSCWVLGVCLITLLPTGGGQGGRTLSLVPLADTFGQGLGEGNSNLVEVAANMAMFAVGGFLVKRVGGLPVSAIVARCLVLVVGIEVLQYVLALGRVSSVDDVLWAGVGSALGAVLAGLLATVKSTKTLPLTS